MLENKKVLVRKLLYSLILVLISTGVKAQKTPAENAKKIEDIQKYLQDIDNQIGNYYLRDINSKTFDNLTKLDALRQGLRELDNSLKKNISDTDRNTKQTDGIKNSLELEGRRLDSIKQKLSTIDKDIGLIRTRVGTDTDFISRLWILLAAAMVFLMQAGFKVFEFGLVRPVHGKGIGMKNLMDWLVVCVVFYLVGFGIMFGYSESLWNVFGTNLFSPTAEEMIPNFKDDKMEFRDLGFEFFLFQLAFAGTTATIVSGAMSERTAFIPYIFTSFFIALLIYPVFGHWVWGNTYVTTNKAWLYDWGFRDFAGSTVVHSIGAWVALVGIIKLGPRIGRFETSGKVNFEGFPSNSLGYSVLGVFILWFGWWGFNGGSALKLFEAGKVDVSSIILNTNIAAAFAGMTAFFHSYYFDKRHVYEKLLGGVLGGLVAITACCNVVSSEMSMFIGVLAGLAHNLSYDLMFKLRLDDPVGAIPVHGVCGVLGTLCVCLGKDIVFTNMMFVQLGKQFLGALVAFVFAVTLSWLFFTILQLFTNLRISPREEKYGYLVGKED